MLAGPVQEISAGFIERASVAVNTYFQGKHHTEQKEELQEHIKRWTYRGIPTKKARKLIVLTRKLEGISNTLDRTRLHKFGGCSAQKEEASQK